MTFRFYSTMVQYGHHLVPIYEALPEDEQGGFFAEVHPPSKQRRPRLEPGVVQVCAAVGDFKRLCARRQKVTMHGHFPTWKPDYPTVLFEHGVGYSFHGDPSQHHAHGSYAGGINREKAVCLPAVNRWVQDANQAAYPNVPSPIVGCPKLDKLVALPRPQNERPVVCISFHWDCRVAPETRWAFSYFGHAIDELRNRDEFELIAHGHPRAANLWRKWYPMRGIEYVPTFDEVCARADVYCNDSSSTLYEFAALDRPVVVLNAPWYRRDVHHGLRFWEHADVGVAVDQPSDLLAGVLAALRDPAAQQKARRRAITEVYPYLGHATERAVDVLHALPL